MKKKVILRSLIGAPIGLSISFIITLINSVIINKGEYYPVVPQLKYQLYHHTYHFGNNQQGRVLSCSAAVDCSLRQ